MGGLFGCVSKEDCLNDLFYGTDYHSHLGTKRGGLAVKNPKEFLRSIHNIENDYFRSKFESDLPKLHGTKGIGIISGHDSQALKKKMHFSEMSGRETSSTELIAMLICEEGSYEEGIQKAQEVINGSCAMLLLTEDGIYVARDRLGKTPIVIGKKDRAFAAASESCAFANLGYELEDLVNAIGLPKEKLCTHCWDGSSYF